MTETLEYKGYKVENVAGGKADFYVYTDLCKGCGLCAKNFPDIFEIKYGKSSVKSSFSGNIAAIEKAAEECPSNAMEIR